MLTDPSRKYRPFPPVKLPDRQWPSRVIDKHPIWMSTDLRDGNQALFEPMDGEKKMRMFKLLCQIGLKEIEAGFPSASQTEFDFFRTLIDRYGADRIAWGSNFPATNDSLAGILGNAQAALAHASSHERDWIFGGTAQRLYSSLKD